LLALLEAHHILHVSRIRVNNVVMFNAKIQIQKTNTKNKSNTIKRKKKQIQRNSDAN